MDNVVCFETCQLEVLTFIFTPDFSIIIAVNCIWFTCYIGFIRSWLYSTIIIANTEIKNVEYRLNHISLISTKIVIQLWWQHTTSALDWAWLSSTIELQVGTPRTV